jgi:hypothetical protein
VARKPMAVRVRNTPERPVRRGPWTGLLLLAYRIQRPRTTPRPADRTDERLLLALLASAVAYLVWLAAVFTMLAPR